MLPVEPGMRLAEPALALVTVLRTVLRTGIPGLALVMGNGISMVLVRGTGNSIGLSRVDGACLLRVISVVAVLVVVRLVPVSGVPVVVPVVALNRLSRFS